MRSLENLISLFVVILCLIVSLFNISHIYLTFIPVGQGTEAWIEDYTLEEVNDNFQFNISTSITNMYDYDKPFTLFIEFFDEEGNSFRYFFDSFIIKSSETIQKASTMFLTSFPNQILIKIGNGAEEINLHIK